MRLAVIARIYKGLHRPKYDEKTCFYSEEYTRRRIQKQIKKQAAKSKRR
jgi:hypothetical protein